MIYLRQPVLINARFNPLFQSAVQLLGILDLTDEENEYRTVCILDAKKTGKPFYYISHWWKLVEEMYSWDNNYSRTCSDFKCSRIFILSNKSLVQTLFSPHSPNPVTCLLRETSSMSSCRRTVLAAVELQDTATTSSCVRYMPLGGRHLERCEWCRCCRVWWSRRPMMILELIICGSTWL